MVYALSTGHEVVVTADVPLLASGDAQVALGLLPALLAQEALEVDQPVHPDLLRHTSSIQRVFGSWTGKTPVGVRAGVESEGTARRTADGTASFFSGGVDSLQTARAHPEARDLVFVHGFDLPAERTALSRRAEDHARRAADEMGRRLVVVRTDLREVPVFRHRWGLLHGAAMAFVAHGLAREVSQVLVPASFSHQDMFPWGRTL